MRFMTFSTVTLGAERPIPFVWEKMVKYTVRIKFMADLDEANGKNVLWLQGP